MHKKGVTMSKIVLEANKIWKKINHHVIINDVSFKLSEGDILGFIGPNGAGKTTIIKLLLGLQTLNGGSVKILNYDLKKQFAKAIINVGAIIENPDLYMYLTGYENLKITAKIYNLKDSQINDVVKLVGLETKINEKVKKYSLGMRQRLGLAQALLHNPKILILDEPMNGLDPEGINDLKNLLLKLAMTKKVSIIISSHLLSELENICTRICIIKKGTIIKDATIKEIKTITNNINYILEVSTTINLDKILCNYKILDGNHIQVNTPQENITNILKSLLLNDISVFEIKKETPTLEEIFLQLTKDTQA